MKLGFLVNNVMTEKADYTTTLMAQAATNIGHDVWYIGVDELSYGCDDSVHGSATKVVKTKYHSLNSYITALQGKKAHKERIILDQLDILWLRNDPAEDVNSRPWARLAGINFARLAMRHGVLVLNNPRGLSEAVNKMYLQYFPEEVRPKAIISRNPQEIKDFIHHQGGYAVLKPLTGSGGRNVFLIKPNEKANINQIIEAVLQDGYIIAQEYLKAAVAGDTRLFLMNGKPLIYRNKIAAISRVHGGNEDMRSNISAGAHSQKAQVTPAMLELAEIIRPKLLKDGMFLVGLDIVGNKLMEINVFSPGGLNGCERFEKVKFSQEIVRALERKVIDIKYYNRQFDNAEMAVL
jgi:glutathione synthase